MKKIFSGMLVVLAFAAAGCGDDDDDVAVDGGGSDGSALIDANLPDARPPVDAARADAQAVDAGGSVVNPSNDGGAGVIQCSGGGTGGMTCNAATQECCVMPTGGGGVTAMCIAKGATCAGGGTVTCDGTEDCNASRNEVCCADVVISGMSGTGSAACKVYGPNAGECSGVVGLSGGQAVLCNNPGANSPDCPSDRRICQTCSFGGQTFRFCGSSVFPTCTM